MEYGVMNNDLGVSVDNSRDTTDSGASHII